jgi:hypothetical protein
MAIGNESSGAFAIGGWGQFILFEHRRILDRREGQGAKATKTAGKRCPEIRPLGSV